MPASLPAGARRLLDAVAGYPGGLSEAQAATIAKLKRSGGTFGTYLSKLVTAGYVVTAGSGRGKIIRPTELGSDVAGVDPLPTDPSSLLAHWRSQLPAGARRMLDVLADVYPAKLTKPELADRAAVSFSGGTFGTYLSRLAVNELVAVDDPEGFVALAERLAA